MPRSDNSQDSISGFRTIRPSRLAIRFFGVAAVALAVAGSITTLLIRIGKTAPPVTHARVPGVFWLSTLLLLAGSLSLHWAVQYVRREKRREFLTCMWLGVLWGTLFVGV